jgi:hypothetical protein
MAWRRDATAGPARRADLIHTTLELFTDSVDIEAEPSTPRTCYEGAEARCCSSAAAPRPGQATGRLCAKTARPQERPLEELQNDAGFALSRSGPPGGSGNRIAATQGSDRATPIWKSGFGRDGPRRPQSHRPSRPGLLSGPLRAFRPGCAPAGPAARRPGPAANLRWSGCPRPCHHPRAPAPSKAGHGGGAARVGTAGR